MHLSRGKHKPIVVDFATNEALTLAEQPGWRWKTTVDYPRAPRGGRRGRWGRSIRSRGRPGRPGRGTRRWRRTTFGVGTSSPPPDPQTPRVTPTPPPSTFARTTRGTG